MVKFDYVAPDSIDEVIRFLNDSKKYGLIIAGGTDLLIKIRKKILQPDLLISLKNIKNLSKIFFDSTKGITIGANVTLANLIKDETIQRVYPTLLKSALVTANPQIRNLGTLVGNICNASPSADNAPILLAMNSIVNIIGSEGRKSVLLEEFFLGPGETVLERHELVESIFIPIPLSKSGTSYESFSQNSHVSCTIVGVATMISVEKNYYKSVRIFIGSCGPVPIRAIESENELINKNFKNDYFIKKASVLSCKNITPITDVRASAVYREKLVEVLVERSINLAKKMALAK